MSLERYQLQLQSYTLQQIVRVIMQCKNSFSAWIGTVSVATVERCMNGV